MFSRQIPDTAKMKYHHHPDIWTSNVYPRTKVSGFTLLELMVAVAIISILVSLAVPSYNIYAVRAKVSEAFSVASPLKLLVADYYFAEAELPPDAQTAGVDTSLTTKYISQVGYTNNQNNTCTLTLTFSSSMTPDVQNKNILFNCAVSNGLLTWQCSSDPSNTPPIDNKYLPSVCR